MRLVFKAVKDVSEVVSNLIDLASHIDTHRWTGCAPFSGSQKIQSIIVASLLEVTLPQCWDTASCLYSLIPGLIAPNNCKYPVPKKKNHFGIDSGQSPACAHLPSVVSLLASSLTTPSRVEKTHSIFALCHCSEASKVIQICLFLGSPSSWKKDVLWSTVWGQHHLRIWFCRQSSQGLDLWFPHAGLSAWSCCSTANIVGHRLWLFIPFCTFSN